MIRPLVLLSALLAGEVAAAEGLGLTEAERRAFGDEVRAAILADPSPVEAALFPPVPDLYAEEVAADQARLAARAELFAPTDRGYGAASLRLTIVFFETYPCADCGTAWAELEALMARYPDIRVEPRFAERGIVPNILLSLLEREGVSSYRAARAQLLQARTETELARVLTEGLWIHDRKLRRQPADEEQVFAELEFETAPAYVLPGMMLQGAMPLIVLEKYVSE